MIFFNDDFCGDSIVMSHLFGNGCGLNWLSLSSEVLESFGDNFVFECFKLLNKDVEGFELN